MRAVLVVSQVALSLLLLAGAGLLIKSFFNLRATNPGFEPSRVLVLDQVVPRVKYSAEDVQRRFYTQLIPKLAAIPGVESVGGANPLPFSGNDRGSSFIIAGEPDPGPRKPSGCIALSRHPELLPHDENPAAERPRFRSPRQRALDTCRDCERSICSPFFIEQESDRAASPA